MMRIGFNPYNSNNTSFGMKASIPNKIKHIPLSNGGDSLVRDVLKGANRIKKEAENLVSSDNK